MTAQKIRLAILGFWLGAMALFSFVVAPSAFAVLPLPQLAGLLVSRVLGVTEIIGLTLGAVLIAILVFSRERRGRWFGFELIITALMTVSMFVSRLFVSSRLHEMRLKFGEISMLAAGDPNRAAFDRLHHYSVWLMGFNLIAALVLIVLLTRHNSDR